MVIVDSELKTNTTRRTSYPLCNQKVLLQPSFKSVEPLGSTGSINGKRDDLIGARDIGVTGNGAPGIRVGEVGGGLQIVVTGES